jgi:hypothetical protein
MIALALGSLAHAAPAGGRADVYVCGQTNPTDYASFALRFRVEEGSVPARPLAATLVDRTTATVSAWSGDLARWPDGDLVDLDAWRIGRDPGGTTYLLRLPHGELREAVDAQIVQVFGGGRAEWVSEFACRRR